MTTTTGQSEANVHRCRGCGQWTIGYKPCTACHTVAVAPQARRAS